MELKPSEEENNEDKYSITDVREELMIPTSEGNPIFRIAHFLKPLLTSKNQPLPKPPFHSFSSNPNIKDLQKRVFFRGRVKPQSSWISWVQNLQKTHEIAWKKVGIFEAIKASTYKIKRDNEIIMCLAEKWCPETNTFVFSWGESTITLEDVMILGGFSVMGNSVLAPIVNNMKFAKIKENLVKACSIIRRNCSNLVTHNGWMNYFVGKGGELEHAAFLVLWLSRFVFPQIFINVTKTYVFGIAISLAFGTKFALAPAVLASIYRDLTVLKGSVVHHTMEGFVDSSELVLWAPFHLVQLWAWERFSGTSPKPVSLVHGEPRMARWHNLKKIVTQNLRLEIESDGDSFVWRPYVMCLKNWDIPKFYCDEGMWVVMNSELDEELLSFVRCLRVCELVGLDCVMQYLPHRVGMQFGMDQGIPDFAPRLNVDYELAWSSYAKPMEGWKAFLPPRLFEGDVTVEYTRWWRHRLGVVAVDDDDDLLITYSRRKRSSQKTMNFLQLLEEGMEKRYTNTTMALVCSSIEGIASENLLNVIGKIAPSTPLYEQENIVADNEMGNMIDYASSNAAAALNEQEHIAVAEHLKGALAQDIELPTMILDQAVNLNQPGLETKKLCSVLGEDRNTLGKYAMETIEVKRAHGSLDDFEQENDSVKHIQESSLVIESRISRVVPVLHACLRTNPTAIMGSLSHTY